MGSSGCYDASARVCVIGAGPSGIASAKALLDEGYTDIVVFDCGSEVGGNWVFDAESGHSSVFETTHIISSKDYSQYDDFPMPDSYADYPSHAALAEYFQDYARHFGLYPLIRFGTMVKGCDKGADGRWSVRVEQDGVEQTHLFDVLVVANGHHWKPRWPTYPGTFAGEMLHSHDFKRAAPFRDRRVLVIGAGNSACDVAVETSRISTYTHLSWRRGYWIVPKFLFGLPVDQIHNAVARFRLLPTKLRLWLTERLLALMIGAPARYGLPEPDHHIAESHPTINSELLYFLRHGELTVRPDIERLEGHTVVFTDGTKTDYDTIIACTGFEIAHPFFEQSFLDYSSGPVPLYLKMIPEHHDNLYFIGLFQPLGCIWPNAALQAKIMARRMRGAWQPPADLGRAIRHEIDHPDVQQLDSPRHTITVDAPLFRARLLANLPRDFVRRDPVGERMRVAAGA